MSTLAGLLKTRIWRHWVVPGLLAGLLFALTPSYGLGILVLTFALAAMGCNLLLGYTGLLSFGQGVFFGVGAYGAGFILVAWPSPIEAIVIASVLGGVVAFAIGSVAIRRQGIAFVMITFAVANMAAYAVFAFSRWTGGEDGLRGLRGLDRNSLVADQQSLFVLCVLVFIVVYGLLSHLVASPVGSVLRGVRENETRAQVLGFNTRNVKLLAFALSGGVTGLAGGVYTLYVQAAAPQAIALSMSVNILIMTILGGTGSLAGSFFGAAIFVFLGDLLSTKWDRWQLILGALLLGFVLFAPKGFDGVVRSLSRQVPGVRKFRALRAERLATEARSDV